MSKHKAIQDLYRIMEKYDFIIGLAQDLEMWKQKYIKEIVGITTISGHVFNILKPKDDDFENYLFKEATIKLARVLADSPSFIKEKRRIIRNTIEFSVRGLVLSEEPIESKKE